MTVKKGNTKFTVAIIVIIVTALLFTFLFLYLGINHRKEVYNDSKLLATEISRKAAFETQVYLLSAILSARSLEQKAQLLHKLDGSREEIKTMVRCAIDENPNYLGAWTLWEPNAFDGKDHLYRKDIMYNDSGTIGVGYFRYGDSLYHEVMSTRDYIGDYYSYPKELRIEYLTEPYKFVYSGYKQVFFGTTISIPIIIDNKFVGAIGIDIDLGNLQTQLDKIRPYQSGYLSLIANNGTIVTHKDTSFIAKNIFELLDNTDTLSYNSITYGKEATFEIESEFTGERVFRMFYPIDITEGSKPWSMMIEIPISKAAYRSKQLLIIAIVTLIIGLSLLIYLIINISERKKHEKDLFIAKSRAEESDRLKSAFLNNISHEIRTPLNGILGFAELVADERTKEEDAKAYRKIIKDSGKQLLSIITNVIELSKIQSGKGKILVRKFEVEKTIQTTIETYKAEAESKKLELKATFPEEDQKHFLYSDEDKFKQILSYLLNNAIKFTHAGYVEVGFNVDQEFTFFVKDTGIGIKTENVKEIFGYFNQGDVSSVRRYGGLGVGLSISKSFVDVLQGQLWLESEEGKGSIFYFSLPNFSSRKKNTAN